MYKPSRIILFTFYVFCLVGITLTGKAADVDLSNDQAWVSITNKWLSGNDGRLRILLKEKAGVTPIQLKVIVTGVLSSILPGARIYQVGVIRLKGEGKLEARDKAALISDEVRFEFIESDEEAVAYLNRIRRQNGYSITRAVQEALSSGEMRGYSVVTEDIYKKLAKLEDDFPKISAWSISVREGLKESLVEVTYDTVCDPLMVVVRCTRFSFIFKHDGQMQLMKKENAGAVGGYM